MGHLHMSFILPVEACYVRGLAIHDHIDLSSQLPFKAAFLSSLVMVLQLLMERIVLEVSILNEVLPHLDFSLSLFNQGHELSCNSVSSTVCFSHCDNMLIEAAHVSATFEALQDETGQSAVFIQSCALRGGLAHIGAVSGL